MKDQMTYALQVPVYHVARVEVVEAIHDIPKLRDSALERGDNNGNKSAHQIDKIRLWVLSHIFDDATVFHPFPNDLEWRYLGGNSKERNNIRVL